MAYVFLLGKELPREWGAKQRGIMPYSYQHFYFFLCEYAHFVFKNVFLAYFSAVMVGLSHVYCQKMKVSSFMLDRCKVGNYVVI